MQDRDGQPRVLIISHSHPGVTHGGAEIAAYALFKELRSSGLVQVWFLGCSHRASDVRLGVSLTQPFGIDEFLYTPNGTMDHLKFSNSDPAYPRMLTDLVRELRPTIVHAHHYANIGIETFSIIRKACADIRIILTLHEFLAICHNYGQMVKPVTYQLCERETYAGCAACFNKITTQDFFLRKRYIQFFLEDVDFFLSPSRFLADRYVAWGLPADRLRIIENVPSGSACTDEPEMADLEAGRPVHIGFFGQMSPLKGIAVLVAAMKRLAVLGTWNVVSHIFGDYSNQPEEFQAAMLLALQRPGDNVIYHGPYENHRVRALMQSVDAIVVPSIWWENSPVVIQEALSCGRPVLCSDIGGMAEMVRPELDGLHFDAGSDYSLAQLLLRIARSPELLPGLRSSLKRPRSAKEVMEEHLILYRQPG